MVVSKLPPLTVVLVVFNREVLLLRELALVVENQKISLVRILEGSFPVEFFHVLQLQSRLQFVALAVDLDFILRDHLLGFLNDSLVVFILSK